MPKRRVQAQGALEYQPPRFVPWVYALMRLGSPLYLRLAEGIDHVRAAGLQRLVEAYREFYRGEARLLVAFRHASVHDPPVMTYLLSRMLPRAARRGGLPLGGRPHAHYLYGRGVTVWAGGGAAFMIPRIGALSVMNRRSDSQGMRAIREYLLEGPFPLALAPEGQVTYHNHLLGPMEAGVARLGFWCAGELERRGRGEKVLLLPLAIQYRYPRHPLKTLRSVVDRTAALAGLTVPAGDSDSERLIALTEALVSRIEAFYARFYPSAWGTAGTGKPEVPGAPRNLQDRAWRLCDRALRVPEGFMGLPSHGDLLSRVFAVRQRGWDYLFRSDLRPRDGEAPLEWALADRVAAEAHLHLRHNELVDVLEYLRTDYIGPAASVNRLIEYALNLADVVNRLMGGDIGSRYSPPHKHAEVRIGEPFELRTLQGELAGGTRAQAEGLMSALQERFETLSAEVPDGRPADGARSDAPPY
ncbi:MAG: hypothetical protein JW820_10935 [Spirochaetales bacterium]|nr:hypothetical protein [Spirochaetales bacterium]